MIERKAISATVTGFHEPRIAGIIAAGLRTVHGTMSGVASMARRG